MTTPPDAESLGALIERTQALPVAEQLPQLCAVAAELAEESLPAHQRLTLLEALRPALWRTLERYEQQELARALPFSAAEMERWRDYIEGWSVMLAAWQQALADADHHAEGMAGLAALLLQRVMRQAVQVAVACFRAYQPVEPALWRLAHEHLRRAEQEGLAMRVVADPTLLPEARGSVADAWLHLLLLDFCDPYGFSPAQQVLAQRWTGNLARLARLSPEPVGHGRSGVLVVLLDSGEGMRLLAAPPQAAMASTRQARYIDLGGAREQLRRLLARVRLGMAPEALGLEGHCTRDEAEQVLERIQQRWHTSRRRAHPRRLVDEPVRIAVGLAQVHRRLDRLAQGLPFEVGDALYDSLLVDQSPGGLGLLLLPNGPRLRCGQLLLLERPREVLLGAVRWMSMEAQAGLRFGVRVLPGRACAAALRTSATTPGQSELALLLPAMPALELPPTLIAAPGTWFSQRELQLLQPGQADLTVVLDRQLEAGADFERISYRNAG